MKKIITILLLISTLLVKSQNMVGVTRKEIEYIGQTEKWKMTTSTTKTGTPFIEVDDEDSYKFYYFNNDTCTMYLVFYNKIGGDEIIQKLDETYPKQDTTWYTNNTLINLAYDEILRGFYVKYRMIKN